MHQADEKWAWLLRQEPGTLAEQCLLQAFVIACHHKPTKVQNGRIFPPFHVWLSTAEITQRTGMHEKTIPGVVKRLRDRGLIEEADEGYGKTRQIKVYRLLIDPVKTRKKTSPLTASETGKEASLFGDDETPQFPSRKDRSFPPSPNKEEKREERRERKRATRTHSRRSFKEWYDSVKPGGNQSVLPDNDPVYAVGQKIGLNVEFLYVHWHWFKAKYMEQPEKKQADWRRTFRNSVQGNYGNLFYRTPDGLWKLTTAGKTAALIHGYDENMTSGCRQGSDSV